MQSLVLKVEQHLREQPAFHWGAHDLGILGQRAIRVNCSFFPGPLKDSTCQKEFRADFLLDTAWADVPRFVLEKKEMAMLACLKAAYPDPPRSLWWHLRAWWRGR